MVKALPIIPGLSSSKLQDHLYESFLNGQCADVRIWVKKWKISWRVHKVVLVQIPFFQSLFFSGFADAKQISSNKGKEKVIEVDQEKIGGRGEWRGEDVELKFDDPNITRTAFEICLSRLYSHHPTLNFPLHLLPSPPNPLAPFYSSTRIPSLGNLNQTQPPKSQLITPRSVLSVLSTAVYLGQNDVAGECMGIVLRSIGPGSVKRYLDFALGEGIGVEEWEGQDEEGVWCLNEVGRKIDVITEIENDKGMQRELEGLRLRAHRMELGEAGGTRKGQRGSVDSGISEDIDFHHDEEIKVQSSTSKPLIDQLPNTSIASVSVSAIKSYTDQEDPNSRFTPFSPSTSFRHGRQFESKGDSSHYSIDPTGLSPHYGFVSDKIGESCVCWLSKWAVDILQFELLLSSYQKQNNSHLSDLKQYDNFKVFRYNGIPARFINALISTDSLFVTGEMERYLMIKQILNMRRNEWELELSQRNTSKAETKDEVVKGDEREGGNMISTLQGDDDHRRERQGLDDDEDGAEEEDDDENEDERILLWEEDEYELRKVFETGIHHSHISFEDLSTIANDIDPSTQQPYAPLPILQAAHWEAANLKTRIMKCSNPDNEVELGLSTCASNIIEDYQQSIDRRMKVRSPSRRVGGSYRNYKSRSISGSSAFSELSSLSGLSTLSTSSRATGLTERTVKMNEEQKEKLNKVYYSIPTADETSRIGAGSLLFADPDAVEKNEENTLGVVNNGYYNYLNVEGDGWENGRISKAPEKEDTFFGLKNGSKTINEILASTSNSFRRPLNILNMGFKQDISIGITHDQAITSLGIDDPEPQQKVDKKPEFTTSQPFRFSVEFWGIDKLSEKERLYSNTVFYGGSYWNVYVQTIKKKDKNKALQLGVYLHRQSLREGVPAASKSSRPNLNYKLPVKVARPEKGTEESDGVLEGTGQRIERREVRERESSGRDNSLERSSHSGPLGVTTQGGRYNNRTFSEMDRLIGGHFDEEDEEITGDLNSIQGGLGTYIDHRKKTKAYFSITCASALGSSLIKFSSTPDEFALSQSWGWKSSALRGNEYLSIPDIPIPTTSSHITSSTSQNTEIAADQGNPIGEIIDEAGLLQEDEDGVLGWFGELKLSDEVEGTGEVGGSAGSGGLRQEISLRATVVVGLI